MKKNAVLLNDTRQPQPWSVSWTVQQGGTEIGQGQASGTLNPAGTHFAPIEFKTQATAAKTEGEIKMTAKIGEQTLTDSFAFRVFGAAVNPSVSSVLVFDPEGKTQAWLKTLGIKTETWNGQPSRDLVIIGREALSKMHPLPGSMRAHVAGGGRLVIMAQHPDYMRSTMGFRVARATTRRVFPVQLIHPVTQGLDALDLRDWSGQGTLLDPYPVYDAKAMPPYGWRWGNRGAVTSTAVEKPHRSGWRPILECDFDLAYSPLLELEHGQGLAMLCTLDLEDSVASDPAAAQLARQMLQYAASTTLSPRKKVIFAGTEVDHKYLTDELGVAAERVEALPAGNGYLAVIGASSNVTASALEGFAQGGGAVMVMAQDTMGAAGLVGGNLILGKSFVGARVAPKEKWLAGLGVSDVRFRSDLDWPVFDKSSNTLADGLLHVRELGTGVVIQTQFDPRRFKTDAMPMFRLTRWRHTRALNQLLANLGAEYGADLGVLEPKVQRLDLTGAWKVKLITPLPNTPWDKSHDDPGISENAKLASQPDFDDASWEEWKLPSWYPPMEKQNGEVVWRKTVQVPVEWEGKIVQLGVGRIKSYDTTFWNGVVVGSTDKNTKDSWNKARRYRLDAGVVKQGRVVIVIRQFAPNFQGGVHGLPEEFYARVLSNEKKAIGFYHPDYREDFDFGDDPYRYYRW